MKFRPTKSPWRRNQFRFGKSNYIVGDDHEIAQVLYWSGSENCTEVEANARLIEIAPDLLELCQMLIDYRRCNGLNFQLEKADDYINAMRQLIETQKLEV